MSESRVWQSSETVIQDVAPCPRVREVDLLVKLFHPEAQVTHDKIEKPTTEQRFAMDFNDQSADAKRDSDWTDQLESSAELRRRRSRAWRPLSSTNEQYDTYFKNPSATHHCLDRTLPVRYWQPIRRPSLSLHPQLLPSRSRSIFDAPDASELHPEITMTDLTHIEGDSTRSFPSALA